MQYSIADTTKQRSLSGVDSNWSPQQQTARMLALCEAQLDAATQDADVAVDTLSKACTDLMTAVQELRQQTSDARSAAEQATAPEEIHKRCELLSSDVASAVVAFQFYDRLSQRLGHVRYSLSTLALFICDRHNSQLPEHWDKLLVTLSRLYRTAEERAIFDSIAGSLSLNLVENAPPLSKSMADAGSVELF